MALVLEPMGRNTAAAIALAALAIERPDDEVMVVLPADQTDRARRRLPRRPADRRRAPRDGRVRDRGPAGHARRRGRPAGDRLRLSHPRRRPRRGRRRPAAPTRCQRFEEKPKPARAEELLQPGGRRLERRDLPVAAAGDRRRARPLHRAAPVARADGRHAVQPRAGLRGDPAAGLDRLRGDGGRGPERPGRDGLDGRRLVGPRVVVGAARGARRARHGRRRPGRRDASRSSTTT